MEEARARLSAALALRDDLPEAHFNFGHILHEMGQIDAAMSAYHKAIALRPTYAEALSNLGSLYNAVGKPDVAIELYHRAIAAKPDAPEPYSNLGNAMQAKTSSRRRFRCTTRLWRCGRTTPKPHSNLGVTYTLMGRYEEAAALRAGDRVEAGFRQGTFSSGHRQPDDGKFPARVGRIRVAMCAWPISPARLGRSPNRNGPAATSRRTAGRSSFTASRAWATPSSSGVLCRPLCGAAGVSCSRFSRASRGCSRCRGAAGPMCSASASRPTVDICPRLIDTCPWRVCRWCWACRTRPDRISPGTPICASATTSTAAAPPTGDVCAGGVQGRPRLGRQPVA